MVKEKCKPTVNFALIWRNRDYLFSLPYIKTPNFKYRHHFTTPSLTIICRCSHMKRYLCLFSMRTRPIIFLKHLWLFLVQPKQTSLLWSIPSVCSSAKYVSSVCCNLTMPKHNDMDDYKNTNLFSLFVGNEVIVQRGSICCPLLCCAVPHLGHTPWTRRGSVALFKGAMAGSSRRTQLCAVTFGEAL